MASFFQVFLLFTIGVLPLINGNCDCKYWKNTASPTAHAINECEYTTDTSTKYECEFDSNKGYYVVKATSYTNNKYCNGSTTNIIYYDQIINPELYEYNCISTNNCNIARIEEYTNSGYGAANCINSNQLTLRQSHITNCCFNITSGISISTCSTGTITQNQWTDSINNNPLTSCNAYINYKPYVIIGGYGSEGMTFKQFDPFDGSLSNINGPITIGGNDPQTFAINTVNSRIYTASGGNSIASIPYDINNGFTLNNIQTYTINTQASTYISSDASNTYVYSASYGWTNDYTSGFQVFKIDSSTGDFTPTTPIIEHRFLATPISHCHCILPNPNNANHFYIADLGRDVVEHYEIIDNGGSYSEILRSTITFTSGYGPRTLAFNHMIAGVLYVSLETAYKVSVISINTNTYYLESIQQTYSTLPDTIEYNGIVSAVGHVDTDNNGKYLYVANRDNARANVKANNIAIFELNASNGYIIDNSLIINDCGGNIPRQFQIDPSNNYMFIANQFGDAESNWPGTQGKLAMYQIDHNNNGQIIEIDIINYNMLGYNSIGLSWIEFITTTQTHEIPAIISQQPNDNSNVCNDNMAILTDKYIISTCDIAAAVPITPSPTNVGDCTSTATRKIPNLGNSNEMYLCVPPDFTVTQYASGSDGLYKPRIMDHIIYQNSLIVYVGSVKPWSATPQQVPGTIVRAMIDINMDGNNDYVVDVFNMNKEEFNVVTIDPVTNYVYVASQENMYRCNNLHAYAIDLALNSGANVADGGCELFIAFPGHSVELTHARHYAEFSLPYYKDLCVAFGADCDNCLNNTIPRTTIMCYNMNIIRSMSLPIQWNDPSYARYVAHGVRNCVGFDWHPITYDLWFGDNGANNIWDANANGGVQWKRESPDDELNVITVGNEGGHYGYPFVHTEGSGNLFIRDLNDVTKSFQDTLLWNDRPNGMEFNNYILAKQAMSPHSAVLGLKFYNRNQLIENNCARGQKPNLFPEEYNLKAIIAEHGSYADQWGGFQIITGYRVVTVDINITDNSINDLSNFVYGFRKESANCGTCDDAVYSRPSFIEILYDGSVLIADDTGHYIWKVTYNGPDANTYNCPTVSPTNHPSKQPTNNPTDSPTQAPVTNIPTISPIVATDTPSVAPTQNPLPANVSRNPTMDPTKSPVIITNDPTISPSDNPTKAPSEIVCEDCVTVSPSWDDNDGMFIKVIFWFPEWIEYDLSNIECWLYIIFTKWLNGFIGFDVCHINVIVNGGMANDNMCTHFPCLYNGNDNAIRRVLLQNKNSNVSMIIVSESINDLPLDDMENEFVGEFNNDFGIDMDVEISVMIEDNKKDKSGLNSGGKGSTIAIVLISVVIILICVAILLCVMIKKRKMKKENIENKKMISSDDVQTTGNVNINAELDEDDEQNALADQL